MVKIPSADLSPFLGCVCCYTQKFQEWMESNWPSNAAWPPSSCFSWAEKGACKLVFYVLETGQSSSKPYWSSTTTTDSTTPRNFQEQNPLSLYICSQSSSARLSKTGDFQTLKRHQNHENTLHHILCKCSLNYFWRENTNICKVIIIKCVFWKCFQRMYLKIHLDLQVE